MHQMRSLLMIASIAAVFVLRAQAADKYTDENRPYEFGFSIDGEQHRHEKKDENGIIMGEFGFITADGVYHVTVYATDEKGNFKILSMKNIRVKPYPTSSGVKKGHSLPFPPSHQTTTTQGASSSSPEPKPLLIEPPGKSCSHCSLPTTSTQAPQLTDISAINKNDQSYTGPNHNPLQEVRPQEYPQQEIGIVQSTKQGDRTQQNFPQQVGSTLNNYPDAEFTAPKQETIPENDPQQGGGLRNQPHLQQHLGAPQHNLPSSSEYPQQNIQTPYESSSGGTLQNYPEAGITAPGQQESFSPENYPQQSSLGSQPHLQQDLGPPLNNIPANSKYPQQSQQTSYGNKSGERNPKQYNAQQEDSAQSGSQIPKKPILISAQMQIVDKNTDIYHKSPGEKDGLPNGLTKDDMMQLLYTFNYTVGFHGHHEEGYTNGVKIGYYYVTARNGVRTRIDYTADDTGFHPKITQEVLDLLSDEVPKPDTEKDEKYGLKGYEFKWIYYPAESKNQ